MNENHEIENLLTEIGREPVPQDVHQLAETITDEFRQRPSAGLDAGDPTQAPARPVPDVPTDEADAVQRGLHPNVRQPSRRHLPRRLGAMLQKRAVRWASAAVVALAVLGGFSIFSHSSRLGSKANEWWMGPPAAVAAEINAALAKAQVRGITCRERTVVVMADGSPHASSTWNRFYMSQDSYRRDLYDGDTLREVQWYVPDGDGMVQTGYRLDTRTWCKLRHESGFGNQDPVQRVRSAVGLLDKADRLLGRQTIDGHQCVGFELRASAYGDNPDTWIDRIWFDVESRLLVQVEQSGRPVTAHTSWTRTIVQDQFNYSPNLPDDTFSPKIPEGFMFSNSPDALLKQTQAAP